MNFFRRQVQLPNYDSIADTPDGWTSDDDLALYQFFNSDTGRKLKARMTNYVIRCALNATQQTKNSKYHNGIARGVALSVSKVEDHFASSARSQSTLEPQPSQGSVAEFGIT
jgi:hypothetical protein